MVEVCWGVWIISYKDFVKVLSLVLLCFINGDSICLCQVVWYGECLFWVGECQVCVFVVVIVYVCCCELELKLLVYLECYELEFGVLDELEQCYYMLWILIEVWFELIFMSLLLDIGLFYV